MVVVLVVLALVAAVDLHQAGVLWIAAGDRVVFQITEIACECHVFGAGDVLVVEEQHLVLQQLLLDGLREARITRGITQADSEDFCTDGAGHFPNFHFSCLL
ncbi:hypothetical protein D3C72_1856520 [compost metagenome]